MGVVARCEGAHDTVVMYDSTAVTAGFLQWTFKSGRLQKLLESFKSIPVYAFTGDGKHNTLFDLVCCEDHPRLVQKFERFGFRITGGKFVDLRSGRALNMINKAQQKRCVDICMGRVQYPGNLKKQRQHAMALANLFATMGQDFAVAEAQIQFAKQEFKRQMGYKRPPLGGMTIAELLYADRHESWETPLAALWWNLWQNHPGSAYRLFLRARRIDGCSDPETYFQQAWKLINRSKFGNWGWGKPKNRPKNKSPRVVRIKKAIKEFYGINVKYFK